MGKVTGDVGSQGKGLGNSRRRLVLVAMIEWYMRALGLDRRSLTDGLIWYRLEHGSNGPHECTVNRVFRSGLASPATEATILGFLRGELLKAYERGVLTPETAPMIVRLDEWPEGLRHLSDGCGQAHVET